MTNHQSKPSSSSRGRHHHHQQASSRQQLEVRFRISAMHLQLIIGLFVTSLACSSVVLCGPNQQQQQQQQSQRTSAQAAADYDKQLLRRALEEANSSSNNVNLLSAGQQSARQLASSNSEQPQATSAAANFQCPEQFGYYTDTRDCTKYYVCVFGEVLHESCTGGLRFSRELQTCDWPRNVDCPQQQQNANNSTSTTTQSQQQASSSTSGSPFPGPSSSASSAATPTTTLPSTNSTTAAGGRQQQQQQYLNLGEEARGGGGGQPAHLKGASLVFADEGSDPQQPSFDEAVSPVITADGAIHLHDGSGGTYSLTPNHNRGQLESGQQQQPQASESRPQEGGPHQNVDVFVKPLSVGAQQPGGVRARSGQQQLPQQQAGRTTPAQSSSKLQPATLPEQRGRSGAHQQQQQRQQQHNQHNMQQLQPQTTTTASANSNQHFFTSTTSEQPPDAEGGTSSEMASGSGGGGEEDEGYTTGGPDAETTSSLAGAHEAADREESAGSVDESQEAGAESAGGEPGGRSSSSLSSSGDYIPPVMAPQSVQRAGNQAPLAPTTMGPPLLMGQRQSSQLLSINNRQVDSSRQTFKPIIVATQPPRNSAAAAAAAEAGNNNNNNFNTNQRAFVRDDGNGDSLLSGHQTAVDEQLIARPGSQQQFHHHNHHHQHLLHNHPQQQQQSHHHNHNQQQQQTGRQQQQQLLQQQANQNSMRQNQTQAATSLHHSNNNNLNVAQNNRQSRMSNFQQQFSPPSSNIGGGGGGSSSSSSHMNRGFLPALLVDQQQHTTMSNNVNFNDSSKLIRLQASTTSQFESSPSPASELHSGASSGGIRSSNSFAPKFPSPDNHNLHHHHSRSQSVLFSQHPFGFVADGSSGGGGNNNNNGMGNNNNFAAAAAADQTASGAHTTQPLQLEGSGAFRSAGMNENSPSPHSGGSSIQLLQQQRRPRPPKRQQIPSGTSSGGGGASIRAATRPTTGNQLQPTGQAANLQQQMRAVSPFKLERDQADQATAITTPSSAATLPTTNGGDFLSPVDETGVFMEPEEVVGAPTPAMPASRGQFGGNSVSRLPLLAPATVSSFSTTVGGGSQQDTSGALSSTAASFATTPPTIPAATFTTAGARRLQQVGASNARGLQQQQQQANANINQGQRSAQLLAPTDSPPATTTSATTTTTTSGGQQDPQLVANRYLNSAIDALEAGQPFGTDDYDFDVLNDNSTDRRNPSNPTATTATPANQTTSFDPNANTNSRQRQSGRRQQQQQAQSAFSAAADAGADAENINLTNGQPSGGQLGPSLRSHQPANSNNNNNNKPRAGGGGHQRQQQLIGGGQEQQQQQPANLVAAAPNLPQTTASSSSSSGQSGSHLSQSNLPTTKKPRPTNKKISVNHEQALANNRASIEPAKRPEAIFSTPTALQTATKCDNRVCRLPDCKCGDTLVPSGLDPKTIPQVILLTFDDAVNDLNWEIYEELFTGRTNPNGCPILATFYVSHEWTDYGQVQTLYSRGHEMASHSITHSFGEKFSKSQWFKEVNGQREILNMYGGVKMQDVRGMRAPFLQIGGNKMFEMLYDANFTYDSSMPIFDNSPPLWPYTLDYQMAHECMITPCPTKSFPGVWEVGMTMWVDLRGGRCSMGDACSNPADEEGVYEMLMKNFNRHYKSNRAPFGLFYHSAWFNTVHHRRGFLKFMGTVNSLEDVFFVTNWQMLQWMRQPTPLSDIGSFEPWQCPAKTDRPPPCFHPSVCNVKSEHGTRFMKTCQPCPANQQYPWVGSTGFKGKQAAAAAASGSG